MFRDDYNKVIDALDRANVEPENRMILIAAKEQKHILKYIIRNKYNKYTKARTRRAK